MSAHTTIAGYLPRTIAGLSLALGAGQLAHADGTAHQDDTSNGLFSDVDTTMQLIVNYEEIAGENINFTPHNSHQAIIRFNDRLSLDLIAEEGNTSIPDSRDSDDDPEIRRAALSYNFSDDQGCTSTVTAGLLGQLRELPTDDWHGRGFDPVWNIGGRFEEINDFAGARLKGCLRWSPQWTTTASITMGRKVGDTPDTSLDATIGFLDRSNVAWGANIRDAVKERAGPPRAELDNQAQSLLDELAAAETPDIDIDNISGEIDGRKFTLETGGVEKALQERIGKVFRDIRQTAQNLEPQIQAEVLEAINDIPGQNIEDGINDVIDFLQDYPDKYDGKVREIIEKLPESEAKQKLAELKDNILDISEDTTRQLDRKEQLGVVAVGLGLDPDKLQKLGIDGVSELMAILRADRGRSDDLSNRLSLSTEWDGDSASFGIGISGGVIPPGPSSGGADEISVGFHLEGAVDVTDTIEYSSILAVDYYKNFLNIEGLPYGNYTWGQSLTHDFGKASSIVHIDGLSVHADLAYTGDAFFGESRYTGVGAKYDIPTGYPELQLQVRGSVGQIKTGQNIFIDEPGLFERVTGDQTFNTRQLGVAATFHF